jgi:hypothetical protein
VLLTITPAIITVLMLTLRGRVARERVGELKAA